MQFNPNNRLSSTYNGGANHQLSSTTICLITTFQTNLPEIDFNTTKIFYKLCEMDFAKQIVCFFSVALVSLSDQIFSHFFHSLKRKKNICLYPSESPFLFYRLVSLVGVACPASCGQMNGEKWKVRVFWPQHRLQPTNLGSSTIFRVTSTLSSCMLWC